MLPTIDNKYFLQKYFIISKNEFNQQLVKQLATIPNSNILEIWQLNINIQDPIYISNPCWEPNGKVTYHIQQVQSSIVEIFGRVISKYIFPLIHTFENYLTPNFIDMYGMYVYACDIALMPLMVVLNIYAMALQALV